MPDPVGAGGEVIHPLIDLWDAFGVGVYLLFGVIHLDLWLRRRDRKGHFWLAAASGSALVVDLTGMAIRRLGDTSPGWVPFLNLLAVAAATICLFELVGSLGRRPTRLPARALQSLVLALAAAATFVSSYLYPLVLAGCFALLVWAAVRAYGAAKHGDRDVAIVAHGFIVLTACLVADLLGSLGVLQLPGGLPILGFIVLFLASSRSLNDRFGREEEASRTDSLTGLPNRRGFLEAGDGALVRSRRSGKPLAVLLGDLDHFKRVNDTLGHAAGDAALRAVAEAIRANLRGQDVAGRWGGEEFIILLPDTDREGALHVAEHLRAMIAALPIEYGGARIGVAFSLGVAEHQAGRNFEETIAQADAALYEAKQAGRNRVAAAPIAAG